jgi:hypothetical protein
VAIVGRKNHFLAAELTNAFKESVEVTISHCTDISGNAIANLMRSRTAFMPANLATLGNGIGTH